jgi:hypothetical protein
LHKFLSRHFAQESPDVREKMENILPRPERETYWRAGRQAIRRRNVIHAAGKDFVPATTGMGTTAEGQAARRRGGRWPKLGGDGGVRFSCAAAYRQMIPAGVMSFSHVIRVHRTVCGLPAGLDEQNHVARITFEWTNHGGFNSSMGFTSANNLSN